MKKFLSLVLALAMTLSLVTISAGAKDFADSDELSGERYEEAVNVMSEMGIIDGYASGDFQPQGTLTRGAAAKIIACMMLGKTTAEALGTQAAPFKDVPAGSTFAGYIAYCVESGLIDGYADGTFRPGNTLTGFAFLKMLLTALGYDSSIEGYTGTNWTVNVAGRATQIGLTDGNDEFVGTRAATREEACLYAVNALQATLVEYENKGQEITVSDGTVITVRPSAPTFVTSNIAGAATSIDDTYDNTRQDYTVEFAEKYQPDLELDRDIDAFGRPAHTWSWKGLEIGTYVDYDKMVAEYTTKVTGRDLYDAIGRNILNDNEYDYLISVDGETEESILGNAYFTAGNLVRSNTTTVGDTGNGVLTQVFVDTAAKEVYIAVVNTYLAVAADDYDEKKDEATYDVWGVEDVTAGSAVDLVKNTSAAPVDLTVDGEDFDVTDVVDGDIVLVRVADGEIKEFIDPEIVSDVEINAFKNGSWIDAAGTQYDYADTIKYDDEVLDAYDDHNMKDTTYNVYLDPYGYAIGVEIVDEADQYLFLTGMDSRSSNLTNRNREANAIFTDGRMETITVNFADSTIWTAPGSLMNTWCEYTVNNNGVYVLDEVANTDVHFNAQTGSKVGQGKNVATDTVATINLVTLDKSHVRLNGIGGLAGYDTVYANDATVLMTVETELINDSRWPVGNSVVISDVASVITGIQNASIEAWDAAAVRASDTDYSVIADSDLGTRVANGVHTLFDDDGYVIAAVVVGEDQGSTTNYAFVTDDDMSREGYDKTTDTYTWTREAIVNGELVTLTEIGDTNPAIGTMNQGEWYEVRYDADGNVRRVSRLSNNTALSGTTMPYVDFDGLYDTRGKYISAINLVEPSVDANHNPILLWDNLMGQTYGISVIGSTLQIENDTTSPMGFAVRSDAKTVLIQDTKPTNSSTKYMDDITEYTGGTSGLERAVRNLNDNDAFTGFIGAVFENGVATSVVIYDKTATDIDTGINTPQATSYKMVGGTASAFFTDAQIWAPDSETTFQSPAQALNALANGIMAAGYPVTAVDANAGTVTYTNGSTPVTVTLANSMKVIEVTYGNVTKYMNATNTNDKIGSGAAATWSVTWAGKYYTVNDGTSYIDSTSSPNTNGQAIAALDRANDNDGRVVIKDGYYQMTFSNPTGWTITPASGSFFVHKDATTMNITIQHATWNAADGTRTVNVSGAMVASSAAVNAPAVANTPVTVTLNITTAPTTDGAITFSI